MADMVTQHDPGNQRKAAIASAFVSATAAGSGDATAVTGLTLDRNSIGVSNTAIFRLAWEAVLAATKTLSVGTVVFQHSDDGSTWAAYTSPYGNPADPGVVGTGGAGGSTERGVAVLPIYVGSAKRYLRMNWTPDLSASGTDTAKLVADVSLAGFDRLPPA